MKKGLKPTRQEKKMLEARGFMPELYLRIKKLQGYSDFVHRATGQVIRVFHE